MKKRAVFKFFTLIEIMMVIVIAAILFGIGIPAFSTMIQGNSMTIAIRQLSAKMQAARAYAVTNRCKVALLLPETGVKSDYCYSAYRVCVVDDSDGFESWIEDEEWKTLPTGVLRSALLPAEVKNVSVDAVKIGGGASSQFPALIFKKNGQLNSACTVKLRQGRYVNSNAVYTERDGAGKIITHPITVNQYTGKVTVEAVTAE